MCTAWSGGRPRGLQSRPGPLPGIAALQQQIANSLIEINLILTAQIVTRMQNWQLDSALGADTRHSSTDFSTAIVDNFT
jgi:hypothetical protein